MADKFSCPKCNAELELNAEAMLPESTDLTISLNIQPGQLCMAKTVAGVLESFAELQVAIGKELGCDTSVFVAGLSYENDTISITTRIANTVSGAVGPQQQEMEL